MTKPCPACDHGRRQELDAALAEGAPYQDLKERFRVSIGILRRHRAHPVCSDNVATRRSVRDKRIYLRFGEMPTGGVSHDWECDEDEAGLSVYRGLRHVDGGYSFDIPLHGGQRGLHSSGRLVSSIIIFVVNGRALYVASGTELAETGGNDEPLLVDATLQAISPFSRVDLPEWLGEPGRRFADVWNRYRRSRGTKGPDPAARVPEDLVRIGGEVVQAGWEAPARASPRRIPAGFIEHAVQQQTEHLRDLWLGRRV